LHPFVVDEVSPMEGLRHDDPREVTEVFTWLACLGAEAFEPGTARALVASRSAPGRESIVDTLLDPLCRDAVSRDIGARLADGATERGLSALLPCLLAADTEVGFTVLRHLAVATPRPRAADLSEMLLSLTVAEGLAAQRSVGSGNDREAVRPLRPLARLRYLVGVMAALDLDAAARSRLFLALSQTLDDADVMHAMVLTSLFPAGTDEGVAVLLDGNDDAVRAVLEGAAARPRGKSEFYTACKAVMALGLRQGLPVLARVYRQIASGAAADRTNLRAMASMVRASVLLAVESATGSRKGLATALPEEADTWTLHLLTLVAPGVKEPERSALCAWLVGQAGVRLRTGRLAEDEADVMVEVVVGASVLHGRPDEMGAEVRRTVLEAMGSLHVRLQTLAGPTADDLESARVFCKTVGAIGAEFRRRQPLASSLTAVMPMVSDLDQRRVTGQQAAWAD
jgi:hypothetical protein